MKKLFVVALLMVGMTILAQGRNRQQQGNQKNQFTREQQSLLILKKMTLDLDLNESQQKEMSTIISEKMAKKEAMKAEMKAKKEKRVKPTNDERFAMHMKMLDEQIATKKRVEKILTAKQFEKWTSLHQKRQNNFQKNHKRNSQGYRQNKFQGNCQGMGRN